MWFLESDAAHPPLPGPIANNFDELARGARPLPSLLRPGLWVVRFDPESADNYEPVAGQDSEKYGWRIAYFGTLRVEADKELGGALRVSGDLYVHRQPLGERGIWEPPPLAKSRRRHSTVEDYRYYLVGERIQRGLGGSRIVFSTYRFDHPTKTFLDSGHLIADLMPQTECVPSHWSAGGRPGYLKGPVANQRGHRIGELCLGFCGKKPLREAEIVLVKAENATTPTVDQVLEHWRLAFPDRLFSLRVKTHSEELPSNGDQVWQNERLHAALLSVRTRYQQTPESRWRYFGFYVPKITEEETGGYGRAFDTGAIDTDGIPREGFVVASHAGFPSTEEYSWAAGKKLHEVQKVFLVTLFHEFGHALGLSHRFRDSHLMDGFAYVARDPERNFPDDLKPNFSAADRLWLLHAPDIVVRPGGLPHAHDFRVSVAPFEDELTPHGKVLELRVSPLDQELPLGAPLRFHLALYLKDGNDRLLVPRHLSLADGAVWGRVTGPGNEQQVVVPAVRTIDRPPEELAFGHTLVGAETLIRGPRGPLLPSVGRYEIDVDTIWDGYSGSGIVSTRFSCFVRQPREQEVPAALRLLEGKALLLTLIFNTNPISDNLPESVRKELKRSVQLVESLSDEGELALHYGATLAILGAGLGQPDVVERRLNNAGLRITLPEIRRLVLTVRNWTDHQRSKERIELLCRKHWDRVVDRLKSEHGWSLDPKKAWIQSPSRAFDDVWPDA